jgi:Plasmid pRiA4b ORF-3-like protein
MSETGTHIVRVTLQDEPTIFREIEVESRRTLSDLAEAVVHAFGFEFDHAFGFYSKLTGQDVMCSQPKYELFADMGEKTNAKSVSKTPVVDASLTWVTPCCSCSIMVMTGGSWLR